MTASIVVVIKWTFIVFVTGFQECHKMKHEVIHLNIFKTCLNWKHWKYFLTRISAKSKTFSFLPQDTKDNSKLPRFSANHMSPQRFNKAIKHTVQSLWNKVTEVWIYLLVLSIPDMIRDQMKSEKGHTCQATQWNRIKALVKIECKIILNIFWNTPVPKTKNSVFFEYGYQSIYLGDKRLLTDLTFKTSKKKF